MIDEEKARHVHIAATGWLAAHPELSGMEVAVEAVGVRGRRVERVPL
jgi:hypothetical protein